jgi:hypothetical protein
MQEDKNICTFLYKNNGKFEKKEDLFQYLILKNYFFLFVLYLLYWVFFILL